MSIYDKKIPVRIKKTVRKSYPSIAAKVPKVQKVEVVNSPETRVILPDIQKVEVTNQQTVVIPDIQRVEVVNPTIVPSLPDVQKVEVTNQITIPELRIPEIQKVQVLNAQQIPIGKANIAGEADPEVYVPVRLTDGKKFYKGIEDAYVSAAKTVMPYVDNAGNPAPVRMTASGNLPIEVSSSTLPTNAAIETGGNLASIKSNTDRLAPASVIYQGTKTVPTGTAEAIASTQVISSVTLKALSTNTVAIYAGSSTTTTSNGFELLAGESLTLEVDDLSKVYVISGTASQYIRYIAV